MKILLLHLPKGSELRIEDRCESVGLGYIAAVLRRDGHEVEVLDAHLQCLDIRETVRAVCACEFDCLGITTMHQDRPLLMQVARAVRKHRKDAIITVGGYLPTLDTQSLLDSCPEVDFVVRGEGENVASDVFGRIARGEDWKSTPGIAYNSGDKVVMNPLPALIQDLDSLPFPARDALSQGPPLEWVSIASSRGCYHKCSFCSVQSFYLLSGGHAPRYRSPEKVVDEIESIIQASGHSKYSFVDDDFIGPGEKTRERAVKIVDEIKARNLKINFSLECRADEVDEDMLRSFMDAGLTGIFLGIESGVQRQLDTYNKRISVEQNKRAIEMVRRLGLRMQPGFIPFDPYTTIEELQENMQFIRDVNLWEGQTGPTPPRIILYPGVPLVEKVREDGLLKKRGTELDYTFKDPSIRIAWGFFQTMAGWSRLKVRVRKLFGLQPRSDKAG